MRRGTPPTPPTPPEPLRSDRLRAQAEAQAASSPAPAPQARGAQGLTHELQVHQIELEMQNEELRQAYAALEATRDSYVDLYDFAPVGYFTLNTEDVVLEANLTGATMLGIERARLVGSRFARCIAVADRDRWHRFALRMREHGEPGRIELTMLAPEGGSFDAQLDSVRVVQGAETTLRLTVTDVSRHKHAEAELLLASTAFEAQEGTMITDAQGVIERVNKSFTRITGYSAEEAVGHPARLLRSGLHAAPFYAAMWESLLRTGTWHGEVWNRRKNGEVYPQWLTITAVRDGEAGVTRYVGTMLDISERKSQEEAIEHLAFHDPLTGLPNRRLVRDRLQQALAVVARTERQGAVMFIDLDHFKDVNDALGHANGDLLLQQVAKRLRGCVREADTVGRLSGDEFVVILAAALSDSGTDVAAQAQVVGEKILAALSRPYPIAGQECRSGASIGVMLFGGRRFTADELLERADRAMYEAKASGRNALRFFDPTIESSRPARSIVADLRRAVMHGELALHYQPIVDRERRLLGAEALVRWQHPSRGLLLPGEFIAIAEISSLIHPLGQWVIEEAGTQLAAWAADPDMARLGLSVNISARQLLDRRFVSHVLGVLDRSGANGARLMIELTKSTISENIDDAAANMRALRARGVTFALDDFGAGYSFLDHVVQLPLDQLKIARSFVQDVLTSTQAVGIAHAVVDLGRSLGLRVVAKGVETEDHYSVLAGQGYDAFQGFLFGQPMSADAFGQLARRGPVAP